MPLERESAPGRRPAPSIQTAAMVSAIATAAPNAVASIAVWLAEAEALLDRHLDRETAFEVWADGYSASEYATALMAFKPT